MIANLALMVDHAVTIQVTSQNITASVPNGFLETNVKVTVLICSYNKLFNNGRMINYSTVHKNVKK